MKIINIVSNYSSLYGGNFIPSLFALAKHLSHDNKVIFSFPVSAKEREWCKYIENNGFDVFYFDKKIIKEIRQINKDNNVTVVYTHFISTPIAKLFAPYSRKIKLFIHIHSDFRGSNKKIGFIAKVKKIIFEKIIRRDSEYIYVSKALKEEDNLKRAHFVRNALCLDRIASDNEPKQLAFEKGIMTFLMFGWSPYVKGVDIAVNAFKCLPQDYAQKCQLVIVYDYNKKDDCADFIQKTTSVNVAECKNIVLVEPSENVFDLYEKVDAFISASRSEGFSYSILEALYCGLPVLMSDIVGTAWAKQYGAISFKANDKKALSEQIMLLSNTRKRKSINQNIQKDFDINLWVEAISNILLGK